MASDLERDLGLYAVVMISMGAMIGSGLFVLPGLAASIAGPAVIVAYFLAGLIALPAALSKAEMATAMPESGGTYLYIDRAMGPLLGTISGIGVWFSLTFKSAFALVGLGAYLVLFTTLSTKLVALGIGSAVILVNLVGVKQTGRVQAVIVSVVLAVLAVFGLGGLRFVQPANLQPFFSQGLGGVLTATGFVFVSYAGVTKIASVAEEVEDPERNIPRGMLGSIVLMMLIYTLIVFVVVGILEPDRLGHTLTPMADVAESFMGPAGLVVVGATAVLALTSMSNAGVLSSSRYPLAMSRDRLAPDLLGRVSGTFKTPTASILLTGGLLLGLVAFVPVIQLAKLASAFKILVFSLVNLALIALREGKTDWYDPSFTSPGYPWVQLFGIVGGLVLLTQMGTLPMIGAVSLVAAGAAWYFGYAKGRIGREGVGVDVLRRRWGDQALDDAEARLTEPDPTVVVGVSSGDPDRIRSLMFVADALAGPQGRCIVVGLEKEGPSAGSVEATLGLAADTAQGPVEVRTPGPARDSPMRGLADTVRDENARVLLLDAQAAEHVGFDPSTFAEIDRDVVWAWPGRVPEGPVRAAVVSTSGAFDPYSVRAARDLVGKRTGALEFVHAVGTSATDAQLRSLRDYHTRLDGLTQPPAKTAVLRTDDPWPEIQRATRNADVIVLDEGSSALADVHGLAVELADGWQTVLAVRRAERRQPSRIERWTEKVLYRT